MTRKSESTRPGRESATLWGLPILAGWLIGCGPALPSGPSKVEWVLAHHFHSCVGFEDGSVMCWGEGSALGYAGEAEAIGDDETPASRGLLDAGGPVIGAAPGMAVGCLLYATNDVRCWGKGKVGLLGTGSTDDLFVIPALAPRVALSGPAIQLVRWDGHACALLDDGRVQCWGDNENGVLGYGNLDFVGDDELPSDVGTVPLGGPAIQVVAGQYHMCALLEGGAVRCWGGNTLGRLGLANEITIGDDETPDSVGPLEFAGPPVVQLVAGLAHTCARHENGALSCWGDNDFGQLGYPGRGTVGDDERPIDVGHPDIGGVATDIACGQEHTCAILEEGKVRCWGDRGQLGNSTSVLYGDDEAPSESPFAQLSGPAKQISAGSRHTCALLESGDVQCWGGNGYGQLGLGSTEDVGDDESPASVGFAILR